ncbi:MAG: 4Fe-4S dicluster domain-containing protein [Myxococcota bacterium]
MARLNRRDFMKALGLAGATAATACAVDDNWYRTPVEEIIPYVVKPEQVTPGTPTFFATTVTTGPDAWPVNARHRDGRVVNVGVNRQLVASGAFPAAVPKSALLELQKVYSPDRIRGPRGAASWDEALGQLAGLVKAAKEAGKTVAYLGPYRSGAMAALLADFTDGNNVHWEPVGRAAEADAAEVLFQDRRLPMYKLANAQYILSFGAAFLGSWGGPQLENDFAMSKDPNQNGFVSRFALVSPHRDQTGAKADDWYAGSVGGQVAAAFAIARLIADEKGYAGAATALLSNVDVAASAAASGVAEADLRLIAKRFADAPAAVALPGAIEDADLAVATFLINIVSGNLGGTFVQGGYAGPVHGTRHVADLVAKMNAGSVGVLLVDDVNPVYSLPPALKFSEALAKVGTVVSLSSQPSETASKAKMVLPSSSAFEDWGDEELSATVSLVRQPAMTPLWDTRSLGDILLAVARGAGLQAPSMAPVAVDADADATEVVDSAAETVDADAASDVPVLPPAPSGPLGFEPKTWREYVMSRWEREHWAKTDRATPFTSWWIRTVQAGIFTMDSGDAAPALAPSAYTMPARAAAQGTGLHLYLHPHRHDGRFASSAWAQEAADPMTGQVWDSWLEVSPELAAEMGVVDNDEVTVTTPGGSINVGVEVYKGLKGKSAALALGQGHTESGRYANDRGVNAFSLVTGDATDSKGNVMMVASGASITKTGAKADLASTFGSKGDSDGGRNWGVSVNAPALAKVGDAPAAHPGELTGIHHLPRDERLQEKKRLNFYDQPDHPTYRFAMTVDTNACDGCGICSIACYAENNLPIVGKSLIKRGREMNWIRINRYWETETDESGHAHDDIQFVPMMCQHCALAPCESVCPVLATYHNIDGLNAMVYNRCVGTRYCANNCPYVVRRFNFHSYVWPEPMHLQLNPDVSSRVMGVMEKCTFCVQRTRQMKTAYRDKGFTEAVPDEALRQLPACAEACPTQALTFGNLNDEASVPAQTRKSTRSYVILSEFNTESAVNYLAKASFHVSEPHHGGGHGGGHADTHGDDHAGDHGHEHTDGHTDDHGSKTEHDKADHPAGAAEHH